MEPRCSRAIIECGQKDPIFTPGGQSNAPDNMWHTAIHTGEISHHSHTLEAIEIATAISGTKLGQVGKATQNNGIIL